MSEPSSLALAFQAVREEQEALVRAAVLAELRATLDAMEHNAGVADHGSIEGGPDFARGMRYVIAAVLELLAPV